MSAIGRSLASRAPTLGLIAVSALLALGVFQSNFVDPDVWHELALMRQAWREGALPTRDGLAYTPTIVPSIHHEWGTGAILLAAGSALGATGLLLLKVGLTVGIAAYCFSAARRSGASAATFCSTAPLAVFLSWYGFSTVRAQMFTLLFTAVLMALLARDREGERRWAYIWLPIHVIWLNLHAGFVVGIALLSCHAIEQGLRHRPARHLLVALGASAALVLVNPYGWTYVEFLARSVTLPRPAIEEWLPAWEAPVTVVGLFAMSLLLVAYAAARLGVRSLPGVLPLVAATWAGLTHQRHLSIYAVVWVGLVPAWLDRTPLGVALRDSWSRRANALATVSSVVIAVCVGSTLWQRPWHVSVPSRPGEHPRLTYPVGAVAWLDEVGFRGNLEVPFVVGAFVAWKLNPAVKVSIDGRYEVAYPPEALQRNLDTYAARSGWQQRLEEEGKTDAVLVPVGGPLASALPAESGWSRSYRDDAYEVYFRSGRALPETDRRGQLAVGTFP